MYAHQKDSEDQQLKATDIEDKDQIEQLPQSREPAKREETLEGKSENELANIKPKPASLGKIMRYYSPKIVAFLVIVVSVFNSFGFPLYGLIFSQVLFLML